MTKRNIILTSILLLVLGVITGIGFNIARARGLGSKRLAPGSVRVTRVERLNVSRDLGERASLLNARVLRSLEVGALNVELPSASLNLLDA